jgi:hypothetical protein
MEVFIGDGANELHAVQYRMRRRRKLTVIVAVVTVLIILGASARRWKTGGSQSDTNECVDVVDQHGQVVCRYCHWAEGGLPDACILCYKGKDVMILNLDKNGKIIGSCVSYYGDDNRMRIMWVDRTGNGDFADRVIYVDGKPRKEVWMDEGWRQIVRSNALQGVMFDGRWLPAQYTNGSWQMESVSTPHGAN